MREDKVIRIAQIMGEMNSGGVESSIMNYYRNIDRNMIQFDFIVNEGSKIPQKNEIEELGGRIIIVPPYKFLIKYLRTLKKVFKENDYKIVHSNLNSLSVFPLFVAYMAGIPIRIAHSHSTTNRKEWKKNLIKNILKPFSTVFATDYFACSEYAGKWLFGNRKFKKGEITIIKNAIDVEKFKYNEETRNKIRKELNIENNLVLGHVGRFMKQKNHDFLIDAFYETYKTKKDIILILIGDGPLEEQIKEKVKQLKIEEKVKFLGTKNNVNEYMQAMDIFLFPSLYEGLGIVTVEAQCAGLICLASTKVPSEVKLSENIKFLENKKEIWKEEILKNNSIQRNIDLKRVYSNGYYIKDAVRNLEKIYINLINDK